MRVTAETKQKTRDRILRGAARLFRKKGFVETTTRDLAGAAGIAAGTLFNYFPTKEALALDLVGTSLDEAHQDLDGRTQHAASLDEALFLLVATELRHLRPHAPYVGDVIETTLSPFTAGTGLEPAERVRVDHLDRVRLLIEQFLGPARAPTAVTMHLYWTLYLGVLAFWAHDESAHHEDSLALLDQSLRLFVASLEGGGNGSAKEVSS